MDACIPDFIPIALVMFVASLIILESGGAVDEDGESFFSKILVVNGED